MLIKHNRLPLVVFPVIKSVVQGAPWDSIATTIPSDSFYIRDDESNYIRDDRNNYVIYEDATL